jgi:hypothetical protein
VRLKNVVKDSLRCVCKNCSCDIRQVETSVGHSVAQACTILLSVFLATYLLFILPAFYSTPRVSGLYTAATVTALTAVRNKADLVQAVSEESRPVRSCFFFVVF